MGAIVSKDSDGGISGKRSDQGSNVDNDLDDSTLRINKILPVDDGEVKWKLLPSAEEAKKRFQIDGTLAQTGNGEQLELRMMLDDPIAQRSLARFAKERKAHDIFMCWLDTHEYRAIPTDDYRRSKALHIFHKYIKPGAVLEIGGIDNKERDRINAKIEESKDDASILKVTLYDRVQSICFTEIYSNIYQQFKKTEAFTQLTSTLNTHYNNVRVEDFEYYNKLGEGGFGFVVMAKKKSTGKYYAMKIQTKSGLLDCFSDDPRRADFEKQAFASCQHPFIINLDYAFQTDALAIMVLGLATAGDLQRAQRREPDERLPEERVRFYAAEIVLALGYMHQLGLMYRDLKPNNVLLNEDGHVLLVDLGGVLDQEGKVLGKSSEHNLVSPLFAQKFETDVKKIQEEAHKPMDEKERNRKQRRMSIMGTFGYMAPEMVIMLGQTSAEKVGYTNAVDWWSLGVTIFKLLTGYRPFSEDNFNEFMEMVPTINGRRAPTGLPEYSILFQQVPYPNYISNDAVDFISRLLDVNDQTRLGSGPRGLQDIKNHKFFSSIDWALLEQKHVEPPYLPEVKNNGVPEQPLFSSFESMLQEFGKGNWLEDVPREDDQKYFATWNFTSPHTLRVEVGLANEMEQYDKNFKIRQLMGDFQPKSNMANAKSQKPLKTG